MVCTINIRIAASLFFRAPPSHWATTTTPSGKQLMSIRSWRLDRRRFLHGVGVSMCLPWLESIPAWGADPAEAPPQRFAALFMANGVHQKHWWASGQGAEMQLGKCLEPMEPLKSKMNYIHGLFNKNATGVGIHPGQTGNVLSGAMLQRGAVLKGGVSMDQVLAKRFEDSTVQSSIVLGCEQPVTGYHETNFSMAYSSHISWRDTTAPVPMEVYPSLAFDALFDNQGSRRMQSILDRVLEHATQLRGQVSSSDKAKLDEYLSSVREVEQRVERMRTLKNRADEHAREKARRRS